MNYFQHYYSFIVLKSNLFFLPQSHRLDARMAKSLHVLSILSKVFDRSSPDQAILDLLSFWERSWTDRWELKRPGVEWLFFVC